MKPMYKKIINLLPALAVLTSCSDFLKEGSGDLLIPKNVTEYQAVLNREGYPGTFTNDVSFIDLMTDDVEVISGRTSYSGYDNVNISVGKGAYLWERDVEQYVFDAGKAYENRYANILACNIVINDAATMEGSQDDRNYCLAQAHALRAFSYFCLVNWYGMPYVKASASTDMGVAIQTGSQVTREVIGRSSVQEVYDHINQNIETALTLFDRTGSYTSRFQMTRPATLLLKSRVALFTENWDTVIETGELLRAQGIELKDISALKPGDVDDSYSFIQLNNPEVLFSFGGYENYHKYMTAFNDALAGPFFVPSQTDTDHLIRQYEAGDNRLYAFFKQDKPREGGLPGDSVRYFKIPIKFAAYNRTSFQQAFRTAEVLLNLAEAYVQRGKAGDMEEAIDCLNELRRHRFTKESYKALVATDFTKESLLRFAREERRRELCFDETHRWNDLRRTGMPRIVHRFRVNENAPEETFVLEAKDANYTLSLPHSEVVYNTKIKDHTRRIIGAQ